VSGSRESGEPPVSATPGFGAAEAAGPVLQDRECVAEVRHVGQLPTQVRSGDDARPSTVRQNARPAQGAAGNGVLVIRFSDLTGSDRPIPVVTRVRASQAAGDTKAHKAVTAVRSSPPPEALDAITVKASGLRIANLPSVESPSQAACRRLVNWTQRLLGLDRVAGIAATLTSTQVVTSVLGLLYWTIAARRFPTAAVGLAGAAIAAMQLLGSVGMLGLGTLLIDRLPHVHLGHRRLLVRTALTIVAAASGVLGFGFAIAIRIIPLRNLQPVSATELHIAMFAAGVATMGITLVLDQAVLALGSGMMQLERNILASAIKIGALVVLTSLGARGGMTIYLSWTIGSLVSLAWVIVRSREGWRHQASRRLVDLRSVRGLGRSAVSHHALNLSIQSPLMLLPPIVAVAVSSVANSYFTTDLLVAGFVFALPFAISIGLFAAAAGDERDLLRRIRVTIPVGIACSLAADAVVYLLGRPILSMFGGIYAEHGVATLRVVVLAGIPFVIKDHYIALRRVQSRTGRAAIVVCATGVLELAVAFLAAERWGVRGMCMAWVGLLTVEAVGFAVPLLGAHRAFRRRVVPSALS
jgi:O-antigen/teichoic acid export membrane protein